MKSKSYWVNQLSLEKHPEGGFYKETYRSNLEVNLKHFDIESDGTRSLSTGIYFLIDEGNFSAFHRIKSDEMWHFYYGNPLVIHMIDTEGKYHRQVLGTAIENNELLQFVVPANWWFASEVEQNGQYSLVGCTVAFGFDFADFELAGRELIEDYPEHQEKISRLIRC